MSYRSSLTRRTFLKSAAATAAAVGLSSPAAFSMAPRPVRRGRLIAPDAKMNIACVGCGGKGVGDVMGVSGENIVALCDVDPAQATTIYERFPDVPKYTDYRRMLRELDDRIDAVTISTPDHVHHAIAMLAIGMGKHVFVQKPLTRTVGEARELLLASRRHGVVTQMGNQGHAGEGVRIAREWVQAGVIGDVREVHIWTNKLQVGNFKSALRERPPPGESPPDTLDWNLWLGPVPARSYSVEYHPKKWRGWWAFGCGALGDIGCHTMDAAFYALDLGAPTAVQAKCGPFTEEVFPDWAVVTYEFPARGSMPPVKVVWYDGGKLPPRPPELEATRTFEAKHGYYMVGGKGVIYDPSEKCSSPRLIPESRMRETVFPPRTIPRVPEGDPFKEWIAACKGGPTPGSNFEYSVPLTEMVLLGNVAILGQGERLEWDSAGLRIPNARDLERHLKPLARVVA